MAPELQEQEQDESGGPARGYKEKSRKNPRGRVGKSARWKTTHTRGTRGGRKKPTIDRKSAWTPDPQRPTKAET